MAVLVTGALGQLGGELCQRLGRSAVGVDVVAGPDPTGALATHDGSRECQFRLQRLDLTNRAEVLLTICRLRPRAVINCAAYTAEDQAEKEPELALTVNALAVSYLGAACADGDCALI